MNRSTTIGISILAWFLLIPATAFSTAGPAGVNIGSASVTSSALSLWIARDQGIFKKHDLEVQTILMRGGPILVASLMAGNIQMGFTTGVSVLGAATQGAHLKMLTSTTTRLTWKLMANPHIKKAEDLRGKRIGIQSVVGSTWMNSMLALEALGLDPKRDNITLLPTGDPPAMSQALEAGRIDAAVLDPSLSRMLVSKGFTMLVDLARENIFFPGLGLGTTQAYLDGHAPIVERVVAASIESIAFILTPEKKPLVLRSIMKNLKTTDPARAEEAYQDQCLLLARKPYPSLEALHNAQRLMALQNPRIASVKLEALIDSRFVEKLDKSGFIDRLYNFHAWRISQHLSTCQ